MNRLLTPSEAAALACWQNPDRPCVASRCMAWRTVEAYGDDMEPVELYRADDDGVIALGRCSALPE